MRRLFISAIAGCIACLFLASTCWALPDLESLNDYELTRFGEEAQAELERRGEKSIEDLTTEELQALIDEVNALKQKRLAERFSNYPVTRFEDSDDVFMGFVCPETGKRITLDMSLDEIRAVLGSSGETDSESAETDSKRSFYFPEHSIRVNVYNGEIRFLSLRCKTDETVYDWTTFNGIHLGDPSDIVLYSFDSDFIDSYLIRHMVVDFALNEEGNYELIHPDEHRPDSFVRMDFRALNDITTLDSITYTRFKDD